MNLRLKLTRWPREVYGFAFTPSLSTPRKLGVIASDDFSSKKRMQTSVGIDHDESEFFASPLAQPALEFLNLFKESQVAPVVSDLSPQNPMALENSPVLRYLVRPTKGLYIFDFGERATRPWLLAVENAAVVTSTIIIYREFITRRTDRGRLRVRYRRGRDACSEAHGWCRTRFLGAPDCARSCNQSRLNPCARCTTPP